MRIKFNHMERIAGLFIIGSIAGSVLIAVAVAVKQGWFETKTYYSTLFENADGVHQGTIVQMSGLKAGAVESVELLTDNHIKVEFYLSGKFAERLHEDSEAQLLRPFVIGERVLDISVGNSMGKVLPRGSVVTSRESVDLLTLMSGRNLSAYLAQVSQVIENLRSLAEAFTSKSRTEAMVRIFDRLDPMIKNLNTMSLDVIKLAHQATDEERLGKVLAQVQITTSEINRILPQMNSSNPNLGEQIGMLTSSVSKLSQDFKGMGSMVKDIEGDLPRAGRRIVEALDETVVVLKALQKSFILKSAAEEVREEESKRLPASPKK